MTANAANLDALATKTDVIVDSFAHTVGATHPRRFEQNDDPS